MAIAALAAMTLKHPRARLIFWQGILAMALLMPALEPWREPAVEDAGLVSVAVANAPVVVAHKAASRVTWRREYLLLILAGGAALRFLWIGAGLIRLRRHRLDARMLTIPPVPFANPRVRWFVSTTVGGPVTFGFLNPSILLPARVAELPADLREAIAHHELAHVRRRDWVFVLFEEAIRSALWFHPALWFVLSRIQLAREQVVDAEVVGLTRDRERYLDALVAVAAQRLLPDVAPASLFLKKRQLASRVAAVLEETRMSKPRMFFSYTTVCSAALVAARLAVWMFPLQAPAQTPQLAVGKASIVADGPGIVVEAGAKILHRSPVFYPSGATATGAVIVESTVDAKGEVTDARCDQRAGGVAERGSIERADVAFFRGRRIAADCAEHDSLRGRAAHASDRNGRHGRSRARRAASGVDRYHRAIGRVGSAGSRQPAGSFGRFLLE